MKKLLLVLVGLSFLGATQAHAMFDLGLNAGYSVPMTSGSTNNFTYGGQLNYHFGPMWSLGAKFVRYTYSGTDVNYLTGSLRFNMMGFFFGGDVGSQMASASGFSSNTTIYGPTVGYYVGMKVKFGLEATYFIASGTKVSDGLLQPFAGIKFML